MKMKSFATSAGAAALALAMWLTPGYVQGQPMYDRVKVNLPYKIVLGEKTLQPGDYTIQQLPSTSSSRVLLFYTDNGMKFETSALTIPVLDINTARDTKLILNHVGDDYYIDKIWVQGKDYGYELPMPKGLKSRENEKMTTTTVAGRYEASQAPKDTAVADNVKTESESPKTNTAQATAPTPVTPQTETQPANETLAQNSQPAPPAQTPNTSVDNSATASAQTPSTAPNSDVNANTADRAMTDQDTANSTPKRMPNTAANWLMMLLSGGTLSGAGLMLRRKR